MADRPLAAALLVLALAAVAWFLKGDIRDRRAFRRLVSADARATRYRFWIAKAVIAFGLPTLVGLALLGRMRALAAMPGAFAEVRRYVPAYGDLRAVLAGALGGLAIGALLVAIVQRFRRSRRPFGTLGDVGALLPRTRGELRWGVALALVAGVVEEGFFRLLLPLLIALVTGRALAGFAVAALLFGAMHLYQGWQGVAATTVFGVLMTVAYVGTGALWVAVLLHIALDLNGLVVRPITNGVWRVRG